MSKFYRILRHEILRNNYILGNHRGFKISPFAAGMKKVSKTLGAPSSSTNLKEVLNEKIPLYYDLIREFRDEHSSSVIGQITVDDLYSGLSGVDTTVRETSEINAHSGIMYRGLTMPEIVKLLPLRGNYPSPESVFWLLLTGDIPTEVQTAALVSDWENRRERQRFSLNEARNFLLPLPKHLGPTTKLSLLLAAFDFDDKKSRSGIRGAAMSCTHWESMYEDSMDVLAIFPAIVGLVKNPDSFRNTRDSGDSVDCLMESLKKNSQEKLTVQSSTEDLLRLIILLNAYLQLDEAGGVPSSHISQIMGSCQYSPRKALAAGFLALGNEPVTGTLPQCMNFQEKVQRLLGAHRKEDILRGIVSAFMKNPSSFPGYRTSNFCDPRFLLLQEFANKINNASLHPDVQISIDISNVLQTISAPDAPRLVPEMNSLAAPLLKSNGLYDMEFNQTVICMARSMGLLASIIWSRIINLPVENPNSRSTHAYIESLRNR
ncbi:probable citrate synthase 2, mitochondrial isoform X2 [Fopius arisanus]|uniref:Probable citrate synthase 2, mitochondrial isoform X2 n=1 Tax=Fopius arisanus TaxID=64838 RepID=A0A9R1STK9_9HYME|nr:PREDICTED: probable citrate synthase 2, mitochondrial isoform X2 [Fopius arisanus]